MAQPLIAEGIETILIRTVSPSPTLWESVIPQCLMGLPGDLAEIDALLDDEAFFDPFRPFFDPVIGRPSIPMQTYIRMMFLKYRYRMGFEPCAGRWRTPWPGDGSAGFPSPSRCPIPPR